MVVALFIAVLLLLDMAWRTCRARAEYRARWALYALRDRVRDEAFKDEGFAKSETFSGLDFALTALAGSLAGQVTIWTVMGSLMDDSARKGMATTEERDRETAKQPFSDQFFKVREEYVEIMRLFLIRRHPIATSFLNWYYLVRTRGREEAFDPMVEKFVDRARDNRMRGMGDSLAPC